VITIAETIWHLCIGAMAGAGAVLVIIYFA
jgi:hypothetical protein